MNKGELKQIGSKWKTLNHGYDTAIEELIDAAELTVLTAEKLEVLKKLQAELFDLEDNLFKILQEE